MDSMKSNGNMDKVKKHFDEEAEQYDGIIKNLIPYYGQMVEAAVNTISREREAEIEVMDLGCGTGTMAKAVLDSYPKAKIACVDISENMLRLAAYRLHDAINPEFINSDFYDLNFTRTYDVIISSLALHHIVTTEDKVLFYKKIFGALNNGGVFVNADVVLASTDAIQERFMEKWKEFMRSNVPETEVLNKWIPTYYDEDRPISLLEHIDILREIGFNSIDVIWKYYNFAVYTARKG